MPRRQESLFDTLFTMAGEAVADVRSKLIDEGWFGRRGPTGGTIDRIPNEFFDTERGKAFHNSPSFEEQWAVRDPAEPHPTHDMDMER